MLLTLDRFAGWYDNEHVPLRMGRCTITLHVSKHPQKLTRLRSLPEFLTGSRYHSTDSLTPSWLAHYSISPLTLFSDPRYTSLRSNRSPREAHVVSHLETLDRRTCRFVEDSGVVEGWKEGEAAGYVVTVARDEKVETTKLAAVEGCRRAYLCQVDDSLLTSFGHPPQANVAPKYIATFGALSSP